MRNIVILNSLHFSYPLPILMRVSYNTLIVKQNTSDYYKYSELMANEVEFKLKIRTDGKDTFHDLTVDAESFDSAVKRVTETARKASDEIQNMAMKNLNWDMFINATDQLNSSIQSLARGMTVLTSPCVQPIPWQVKQGTISIR